MWKGRRLNPQMTNDNDNSTSTRQSLSSQVRRTYYVLYSPSLGIYLGQCMGFGFWSNLDPVDQPSACAMESIEEWESHISSWLSPPPDDGCFVPISCLTPFVATREEVVAVGLPSWYIQSEDERERIQNPQ